MTDSLFKRFFIIDAFAYIFRAYYAIKHIDYNAVYGFTNVLKKIIENEKPDYIAVSFDSIEPSFRKEIYEEYKANRPAPPEDLAPQIPLIKEMVAAFNIILLEKSGYESDDIIGTVAEKVAKEGIQVVIVSGDKDMFQLVRGNEIIFFDSGKKEEYLDEQGVLKYFGCLPNQVVDLLTIWGDSSDNIPGIPGIGEKGAKGLIEKYGSLENIYQNIDEISRKSYKEGLESSRERIPMLKKLVTIDKNVPLDFELENFSYKGINSNLCQEIFTRLNFKSLLKNLPVELTECKEEYTVVKDAKALDNLCSKLNKQKLIAFDLETDSLDTKETNIIGISFGFAKKDACYVPIAHQSQDSSWKELVATKLKPIFANKKIAKCAHNAKFDWSVLKSNGWDCKGIIADTMIYSYLLEPNENRHGLDYLAEKLLQYKMISYEEVCGTGKKQISFAELDIDTAGQYSSEDADICIQLYDILKKKIDSENVQDVFDTIELPLIEVLMDMEQMGICVDTTLLSSMSDNMAVEIEKLQKEIYHLAGEEFNINSTQQLGHILFEKLGIEPLKKTGKTKSYSTEHDVLEKLAEKGHPLPIKLLEYRSISKLKSTYVDAIPKLVSPVSGRVHTSFNQVVAATGRLSSTNPNLQNIPIRTEMGKEIRAAFIPQKDWLLISADYSQIELRIMAHYSGDTTLVNAFKNGEDIHVRTASEIFDIPIDVVPPELRRAAKSINFGLLYGMGDFRLAQELNISRKEAKKYMESYFAKMPEVESFRQQIIEEAKENGIVRTYFGRLRQIPEINSRNKMRQKQGERLAVNTVIQGTAADIIKIAMISIANAIKEKNVAANMLLQVHDELVFECPESELADFQKLVKKSMENVISLKVPLITDMHIGKNWKDAK